MNYIYRQKRFLNLLESRKLDAFLIRKKQNIMYLIGVKGDDSLLFISRYKNFLITDARYTEEYRTVLTNCRLIITRAEKMWRALGKLKFKIRPGRVGFESEHFSYSEFLELKRNFRTKSLVPIRGLVEGLREVKDKEELTLLREACKSGCRIMEYGIGCLKEGKTETFTRHRIEQYMAKKGIEKANFDIIVASGQRAAMPHATPTNRKLKKQEMVVIDLGTMNYGYNSDLTRTVFLGRINKKYSRIYNIVRDAQKKAIESIRPGIRAKSIDEISRQYIATKGLGQYFVHSLGHGIGLEPHERPHISRNSSDMLEENMVFTIEPGIYIPGWGGVRFEDVVRVTRHGVEVLTDNCKKDICR